MTNRWGNNGKSERINFLDFKITADGNCSHEIKTFASWKESYDKPRPHIRKQRYYFTDEGPSSQSYYFSSSHVWMWELDYKESWALKNWWFWTVVLEKTLESPLDYKKIQSVHLKGNQSWILIQGLMLKLKLQYLDWSYFFLIHSALLCALIGTFSLFTF